MYDRIYFCKGVGIMKITKKAVALLATGTIALSTMGAAIIKDDKPNYYNVNNDVWVSEEDYKTYTYYTNLNEQGYYENELGEIVSVDDLNMGDLVYAYIAANADTIYEETYENGSKHVEGYSVLKAEKIKKPLNFLYDGNKIYK